MFNIFKNKTAQQIFGLGLAWFAKGIISYGLTIMFHKTNCTFVVIDYETKKQISQKDDYFSLLYLNIKDIYNAIAPWVKQSYLDSQEIHSNQKPYKLAIHHMCISSACSCHVKGQSLDKGVHLRNVEVDVLFPSTHFYDAHKTTFYVYVSLVEGTKSSRENQYTSQSSISQENENSLKWNNAIGSIRMNNTAASFFLLNSPTKHSYVLFTADHCVRGKLNNPRSFNESGKVILQGIIKLGLSIGQHRLEFTIHSDKRMELTGGNINAPSNCASIIYWSPQFSHDVQVQLAKENRDMPLYDCVAIELSFSKSEDPFQELKLPSLIDHLLLTPAPFEKEHIKVVYYNYSSDSQQTERRYICASNYYGASIYKPIELVQCGLFCYSIGICQGSSGGAILNKDWKCIGVHFADADDQEGTFHTVDVREQNTSIGSNMMFITQDLIKKHRRCFVRTTNHILILKAWHNNHLPKLCTAE